MPKANNLKLLKKRRSAKVRMKIKLLGKKRKLCVFRSNRYIWAQIVDLGNGKSVLGFSDKALLKKKGMAKKTKTERAFAVGREIAARAIKAGIKKVAFDRGPYCYQGRVKALAEGARAGGLIF